MIVIGLTGGIGSGKSTVSEHLVARSAVLIDADALVKKLQSPGGEVYGDMVAHFGEVIVADDGTLNRQAIADIVFSDKEQLKALNEMVHPVVNRVIREQIRAQANTDNLVVLDIPLLIESLLLPGPPRYVTSGVLVVDTPPETAIARLVEHRGFAQDDAEKRIKNQVSREKRLELADFVVDNGGALDALAPQLEAAWEWATALPPTEPTPEPEELPVIESQDD
ncbi:MAG: dephospho-CoA kinase [Candidatus Poriferisodalaceae bacterium]|jgi:dephospho-CoA kinase